VLHRQSPVEARWFLRDFLYAQDLLGREEVDEKALSGLRGVVKISRTTVNGTSLLNFDGFAFAALILFRASLTVILGLSEIRVSVLCSELTG
jgi:hypothetical protein